MDFSDFAWCEVLLVALALAGIYLTVAVLGLVRLRRSLSPRPAWTLPEVPTDPLAPVIEPTIGPAMHEQPPKADFAAAELMAIDVFSPS
jgi:hypothetical protein